MALIVHWQLTLTCSACPGPGLEHADRSGFLDAKELQKALAMGNLHYGLTDVDQVQSHGLLASANEPLMQHVVGPPACCWALHMHASIYVVPHSSC